MSAIRDFLDGKDVDFDELRAGVWADGETIGHLSDEIAELRNSNALLKAELDGIKSIWEEIMAENANLREQAQVYKGADEVLRERHAALAEASRLIEAYVSADENDQLDAISIQPFYDFLKAHPAPTQETDETL